MTASRSSGGDGRPGPLAGVGVVELAGEWSPMAGKLLADMGADVILVEPPGGHPTRSYEPYLADRPGPDRSLWWWTYHTSKRAVELDWRTEDGRAHLLRLISDSDVLLESEVPGVLEAAGLTEEALAGTNLDLVWTSVTPFGRADPRSREPAVDLTLMAGAGPVWMCGYDDHTLPPVRGEGNQSMNVAGIHAAIASITALLARGRHASGQRIDVSVWAALNVATEGGTYEWLTMGSTLMRQTGRHASAQPSMTVQLAAADGNFVTSGFPPRHLREVEALLGWLTELGLADSPEGVLLTMARDQGGIDYARLRTDPIQSEMMGAGREALWQIAGMLPAKEFFVQAQERGLAVGVINSVQTMLDDAHVQARHGWTEVVEEGMSTPVSYPPPPFQSEVAPYRIRRRAPGVGEHNDEVLG
jgi:crotonobetainyl-CoA:carnitine CoA-transferase CaiB-like acyl-CoA transferase